MRAKVCLGSAEQSQEDRDGEAIMWERECSLENGYGWGCARSCVSLTVQSTFPEAPGKPICAKPIACGQSCHFVQ